MSEIIRRTRRLLKFPALFIIISCITMSAYAQVPVRGVVTDNVNNTSLQGVTVTVKGTNNSVTTDADGNFSINASAGATSSSELKAMLSVETVYAAVAVIVIG